MVPRIIYFDLGNVLLRFSHDRQCRQMAEVAGVQPDVIRGLLYEGTLGRELECGSVSTAEAYEQLCATIGTRPDFERLREASNDIFQINVSIIPLVARLAAAGYRLGLLSNTSHGHWTYLSDGRYASLLPGVFDPLILSYEHGAMKPDASIFLAAAEEAGVQPEEVFYIDDLPANVEGAKRAGFDAVQYVGTGELAVELRKRGVRFSY